MLSFLLGFALFSVRVLSVSGKTVTEQGVMSAHGQVDLVQKLSGVWFNELGSTMNLTADKDGGLSGQYNSAVGKAEDFYILAGRYDAAPESSDEGVSLGWVVNYRNSKLNAHSTAAWSGQYFDFSGPERILTHWLLTSSTPPRNVWESTNVGHDFFLRTKPSAAEIAQVQALKGGSPDPEQIVAKRN